MGKIFQDAVHGTIELCGKSVIIIDTKEFQRLRNIKQLGTAYYVFPSASHNRFEHSLGTAYLGKTLLETIRSKQPELGITEQDVEDVEIAGLCHDLGHGPFSHLFDDVYLKERDLDGHPFRHHEERSIEILRRMIEKYQIPITQESFKKISLMINPTDKVKKHYLYQIVSNSKNGIDVDKFDYIARDGNALGIKYGFEHHRIFPHVKVIKNEICYSDKVIFNIYELFDSRFKMHKQIYNHPTVKKLDLLIADYLRNLDKIYPKIGRALDNLDIFCELTDAILEIPLMLDEEMIREEKVEDLRFLRGLIIKLRERKLYRVLDEIRLKPMEDVKEVFMNWTIKNEREKNLIYIKKRLSFSSSSQNPLYKAKFYSKDRLLTRKEIDLVMGSLVPRQFEEFSLVIFSKE